MAQYPVTQFRAPNLGTRLSSAKELASAAPGQFAFASKFLNLKRVFDNAVLKNQWEQERQERDIAGSKERAEISASAFRPTSRSLIDLLEEAKKDIYLQYNIDPEFPELPEGMTQDDFNRLVDERFRILTEQTGISSGRLIDNPTSTLRIQAIRELKSAGYPLTEENINAVIQQLQGQ